VKLDRGVEAADPLERLLTDSEVATIEDRADPEEVLDQQLRGRSEREIVGADQRPPRPVPIVVPVGTRQRDERGITIESPFDALQPRQRCAAVRIEIDQKVARRVTAPRLARDHQAFARLVHHTHVRDLRRHEGRLIGARIVDDQKFVGDPGLGENGMKAGRKIARFIMRADNDADCHPLDSARTNRARRAVSAIAARVVRRNAVVYPRAYLHTVKGLRDGSISNLQRMC
jgi:hypothetical protein